MKLEKNFHHYVNIFWTACSGALLLCKAQSVNGIIKLILYITLQMEDEYDMEVEIERQLALEEEEIAEMQESLANHKLSTTAKV